MPFANLFMNEPNDLHEVGVEGTKGLVNIDQHDVFPAFKYPGYAKLHSAWNTQWQKWKTAPFNSRLFEHANSNLGSYMMDTYWLLSVIERAKSTDPEKMVKIWEGDTFRFANGKVVKMRPCDHKAIQIFTVSEYVPPDKQKDIFQYSTLLLVQGLFFLRHRRRHSGRQDAPLNGSETRPLQGKIGLG